MWVPLLNFEGGPGVPLLNLEGWSRSRVLGFWSHFYTIPKKILTNLENVRQVKVQKRFIEGEKKQSMEHVETNSSASYSS